jgi:hypothetical protein
MLPNIPNILRSSKTTSGTQHGHRSYCSNAWSARTCSSASTSGKAIEVRRVSRVSIDRRTSPGQFKLYSLKRTHALCGIELVDSSSQQLMIDQSQGPSAEDILEILPLLSPKQLADAIWGFAKSGQSPDNDLMVMVAEEVKSKLDKFRSQDLSNIIWALAVLKYQPENAWWDEFERQVYTNVTDFNGRELANLMWAFAILERQPGWITDSVLSHAMDDLQSYSANSLHLVLWSLGKLGHSPGTEWMTEFLRASQACFFQFTPSEMANLIWAFAKLGTKLPDMWLDNFLMVTQWRFPSFSAKLLSILVWSTAMLERRPSREWMLCFEQQVRENFDSFSGQELACVAWALRRFGYTGEANAVIYMMERQDSFRLVDFEILSNSKLLSQVMAWRGISTIAQGP